MFPVVFVSHGAPTFALDPGAAGPALTAFGEKIAKPKAVIVLSPHWQTSQLTVSGAQRPVTIHDFYGFPAAMYQINYPVAGAPDIAQRLMQHLTNKSISIRIDHDRGLDHGAWVPMRYVFPAGDVPVLQLSLPVNWQSEQLYQLGLALRDFMPEQVLFIGSGSLTHNLYEFRLHADGAAAPYATEFSEWISHHLLHSEPEKVIHAMSLAPHAKRSHPTDEHFIPLSFVLGLAGDYQRVTQLVKEIRHSVLSMDAYVFDRSVSEVAA